MFQALLCNSYRKKPKEIREQAKDFESKEKRSLCEEMAINREKNQSTAIRKVFGGGEEGESEYFLLKNISSIYSLFF